MIKKRKNYVLVLAILMGVCLIFGDSQVSAGDINWLDYDEGLSQHKESEKKVFINFYAKWCTYCKVMEQETFTDPAVISYLNENFIPVRVNSEKEPKTAELFRVRSLPDTWFINETGDIIGHRKGYIPSDVLINMLRYIGTDSYKKVSYQKFVDEK
jgi:thioredoxin-related protein